MSLTYPLDLLPGFPGWTPGFSLKWRQEQSTQASGRILVKDMGSPLWTLRAVSKVLSPNNLDLWRAKLTSLENGLQTFKAYPMSRCYPILYPHGSWPRTVPRLPAAPWRRSSRPGAAGCRAYEGGRLAVLVPRGRR